MGRVRRVVGNARAPDAAAAAPATTADVTFRLICTVAALSMFPI
ncbi:MAG: hypothetical protein QOE41_3955, partial [Mycobacterium sp.]|nr:hypothetical protein [Mycobacterium sp.]